MARLGGARVSHRSKQRRRLATTMMEKNTNGVVPQHHKSNPSTDDDKKVNNYMEIDHCESRPNSFNGDQRGPEITSFSKFFHHEDETLATDLQEAWPMVKLSLAMKGISCTLNLVEGSMTVSITSRTRSPVIFVKAMGLLELLSIGVPASKAIRVLKPDTKHEIIKMGNQEDGLCAKFGITKNQFVRQLKRLDDSKLKEISEFTDTDIFVQGNTVAGIGSSTNGMIVFRWLVERFIGKKATPSGRIEWFRRAVADRKVLIREMNKLVALRI